MTHRDGAPSEHVEQPHLASPSPDSRIRRALGPLARVPTPAIFAGSLVLAIVVLWLGGAFSDLGDALRNADYRLLVLAAPVYLVSLWILCFRWHYLVRMAHGSSHLARAAEAFLTSVVINYAAPIGLAVPSRAALTKRALGLNATETGIIALWEIAADVIVLAAGSVLWLLIADGATGKVADRLHLTSERTWLAIIALIVLAGLAVLVLRRFSRLWIRARSIMHRLLLAPRDRPREAAICLLVSLIYWLLQGVVIAMIVAALDVSISFRLVLGLTTVPILIGMLSPVPGGAAVREGLMYVVAEISGAPSGRVLIAAFIYRLALFGAIPILYLITRAWLGRQRPDAGEHDHDEQRLTRAGGHGPAGPHSAIGETRHD